MAKTETEKTLKGKPAAKKTASKTKANTAPKKSAIEPASSQPRPEERYRMIQDAAYHIAEKDGFQRGREQDYWLQAEKEIDGTLDKRGPNEAQDVH